MTMIILAVTTIIILLAISYALIIRRKLNKIEAILAAGKKISSEIKMKKLIQGTMEVAKEQVGAEACSLYLVDQDTQELYFEVALGEKGHLVKELRFKINDTFIAGWVATYQRTLNIKDVTKDERFKNRKISKIGGFAEKAFLTMPIVSNDKLVGIIQVINKLGGGYFTKADEELMQLLIDTQIAPNLEKSRLYKEMQDLFIDSIQTIANAIDAKDEYTQGHCTRVAEYSLMIGKYIGMNDEALESLHYSAILHDVGKIGIKDSILNGTTKLTDEEFAEMKSHVTKGANILEKIKKTKPEIVLGAKYHHERYDGKGYAEGISGEDIPLYARIIAVADVFDAMTSTRSYRKGLPVDVAVQELIKCSGTQFDKRMVDAFVQYLDEKNAVGQQSQY